jgi:hypothetical protein
MAKVRFIDGPLKGSNGEVSDEHYRLVTGTLLNAPVEYPGQLPVYVHYVISGRINDIHLAKLAPEEKAA